MQIVGKQKKFCHFIGSFLSISLFFLLSFSSTEKSTRECSCLFHFAMKLKDILESLHPNQTANQDTSFLSLCEREISSFLGLLAFVFVLESSCHMRNLMRKIGEKTFSQPLAKCKKKGNYFFQKIFHRIFFFIILWVFQVPSQKCVATKHANSLQMVKIK